MVISPSVLSAFFKKKAVNKLNVTDCNYIHIDVMDGLFVRNKSLAIKEVNRILVDNKKPLEVHLMVEDNIKYIIDFLEINPVTIIIHLETKDLGENIKFIKSNNIKCGIAIKPKTDINEVFPYLKDIDLVLIMSVEPGYGGQEFIFNTLSKIKVLKEEIKYQNPNVLIEVDGGINENIVPQIEDSGADAIVVGSYIVKKRNYQEQINKLKTTK